MSILWRNPGMIRALFGFVVGGALGFGLVVALRAISGLEIFQTEQTGYPHVVVPAHHRPARLPGRHGLLQLLVPLGRRRAHDPRGPLPARGQGVEGLLPLQHRSQGDRHPVHLHDVLLLHRRRPGGDDGARRARQARHADRRSGLLRRPLLDARRVHDLPVHHPRLRGDRELRPAADDRRAGHGVPAPERAVVLDAADGGPPLPRLLLRARRRLRRRLDRLRAALDRSAVRPVVLQPGSAVRGRLVGGDRPRTSW